MRAPGRKTTRPAAGRTVRVEREYLMSVAGVLDVAAEAARQAAEAAGSVARSLRRRAAPARGRA